MFSRTLLCVLTFWVFSTLPVNSKSSIHLSKGPLNGGSKGINKERSSKSDDFPTIESCSTKPELQEIRSKELKTLVEADQADREGEWGNLSNEQWLQIAKNDLFRRKRVGKILGEGCFKTPEDYEAASLIFQHGDVPDHYFQAFIWANRAVELGNTRSKHLVALTIDRYLVNIGKRQLFGSQFFAEPIGACYCLQPVEDSFPDSLRKDYIGLTLQDSLNKLPSINSGKDCPITQCSKDLQPSPKGTVPGFW